MTRTISSQSDPRTKYFLTINPETGKAEACSCPDRTWRPNRVGGCKHIAAFNAQMVKVEAFQQAWHALDFRSEAQCDERANRRINLELMLGY